MRKIKNMFLVLMTLMIVSSVQGQNPQTIRKTLGTSNDTTLFGVKGSRTIKIENIGTDSVFTYMPDKDGNFSATNFIAIGKGDKAVIKFDGIKIINKGKSAGVNIIMYINDVDVIRKTSGLDTSKSYNFTSPITFNKLIANRILSNEIDSVHSTYWYNDSGRVIGYINSATSEIAFFDKMTVGEMNTTTTVASNYIWTNNLGTDTLYGNSPIITKDTLMPLTDNYATLGTDQYRWSAIYGYKVALGTANNLVSKLAIGMTDSTGAFNIVRSDKNTNRSTLSQATDTSSFNFRFTPTGKPVFNIVDNAGSSIFSIDSSGNVTSTKVYTSALYTTGSALDIRNSGALIAQLNNAGSSFVSNVKPYSDYGYSLGTYNTRWDTVNAKVGNFSKVRFSPSDANLYLDAGLYQVNTNFQFKNYGVNGGFTMGVTGWNFTQPTVGANNKGYFFSVAGIDSSAFHIKSLTHSNIYALKIKDSTNTNVFTISNNGNVSATNITLNKLYVSSINTAPSSSSDTGTTGEIRFADDAIYICTSTNTWKKTTIATW